MAKIIVANSQAVTTTGCSPIPQKIVSSPLITVMNTPGPITVVKSSLGSSTTSHFTLVNSAPIYVKSPTITLLNAPPITVVKAISGASQPIEAQKNVDVTNAAGVTNNGSLTTITEKTLHNVFVKKALPNEPDIPQSHKLLTANSFPSNNMIQNANATPLIKTVNGHRPIPGNKVKILSNVVMPNTIAGPSNVLLNKSNNQRFYQQKNIGNGAAKYLNKPVTSIPKPQVPPKAAPEKPQQKIIYAPHKSQIKTLSNVASYTASKPGIKTLSPQNKSTPGQVQKTGSGLRTIPPQRQHKPPSKPNYIGKHAVQAQKLKQSMPKMKQIKQGTVNSYQNRIPQSNQVTFNQALTAQILETLQRDNTKTTSNYESSRYETNYSYNEPQRSQSESSRPVEYKPQSNLDTLSFVCQAVLLDHNYNATLPTDLPMTPNTSQLNGVSNSSLYSPGNNKRQRPSLTPTNTLSSLSTGSLLPSNTSQEDDAASDISCTSDRKPESEGEETDTAPEAEAVANDDQFDRYGDYVTRCICGFIHDDGYMIECDQCKVWQHVRCVVRNKKVPDDYLCEECDPSKPTDRQKARAAQQQWMREVQERDARIRKEQLKETLTDSDSSDGEQPSNNNINLTNKSRRKPELKQRPRRERDKRQLKRKMTKRKIKTVNKSNSEDEKQQIPHLRQWIDNYEEAVTNHYSPELRARISSIRINGAHSELIGQVDPQVQKCKVQFNPSGVKCLVATMHMSPETPIIELRGKYMLSTQHRTSSHLSSLTTRQQRPGPFLFFYRLHKDSTEVCVDTRTYGNIARFVRRSCQPNAELRHCIEKGVLHLYIVTINSVDKNTELTIKHESHDLAAAGTAEIPCACGNVDSCNLKSRKNGDVFESNHRKRRGRRTSSISVENTNNNASTVKIKEEPPEEKVEIKQEPVVVKPEVKEEPEAEEETVQVEETVIKIEETEVKQEVSEEEDQTKQTSPPLLSSRRSSHHKNENEEKKEPPSAEDKEKNKKLSREERKLQAIMKAIERMEKQEQRKQEHQAKQAHRRESEPTPHKEEEKAVSKGKRRKRKGRTRTLSTNSQHGRRNRLNSADSINATSSDDTLLSPNDQSIDQSSPSKAAGLLLALANADSRPESKSPERIRDIDSNSNSSPETPLSSACLLVAAAVEPLEPGFKFPKTKKGLMNEWLNKGTDIVQSASSISPSSLTAHITPTENIVYDSGFYTPSKNLVALAQAATYCDSAQPRGNAKKRWLRQAISEDQCDSPSSRPDSPPNAEMKNENDVSMDMVTNQESDSMQPMETENPDISVDIKHEYNKSILTESQELTRKELGSLLDPRLSRDRPTSLFSSNSEHLVGTVEKTLSFLGFDDKKTEQVTPAKRKLSITEYRQRKKLNNNEKSNEEGAMEESNLSQSPKPIRNRSNSSSSASSCATSDDEPPPVETTGKVLSAFNSEPTELERQRENVSLRLKKAFGLSVDEESRKPALNVETLLKCDLPTPMKSTIPLSSPTFPIPGSSDPLPPQSSITTHLEKAQPPPVQKISTGDSVMYYTPDEEELEISNGGTEKVDSADYVPPFNNPLYPNSTYTNYGSVIDDDVPYEGRNPSPPPDLSGMP
ncbi:upset isoform a [Holotrichia oblita]|uniref:Upset isoform a n=1 Tax=Holotrichia oblita TaxID=644536 RepID=A0ACB9T1V8_HOLOL|nr:upset isoform a [Holotrichia oblita]